MCCPPPHSPKSTCMDSYAWGRVLLVLLVPHGPHSERGVARARAPTTTLLIRRIQPWGTADRVAVTDRSADIGDSGGRCTVDCTAVCNATCTAISWRQCVQPLPQVMEELAVAIALKLPLSVEVWKWEQCIIAGILDLPLSVPPPLFLPRSPSRH